MAFWTNVWTYIKDRLNKPSSVELIVKSFGAMLTIWIIGFFASLISLVSGQPPNWGIMLATGLGSLSQFLVVFIRTVFGKKVENGNGNTDTPT